MRARRAADLDRVASFAAPQVAGLVALMLSKRHGMSSAQLMSLIMSTADPVPSGDQPDWAGAGRVNMPRAVRPPFRIGLPGAAGN